MYTFQNHEIVYPQTCKFSSIHENCYPQKNESTVWHREFVSINMKLKFVSLNSVLSIRSINKYYSCHDNASKLKVWFACLLCIKVCSSIVIKIDICNQYKLAELNLYIGKFDYLIMSNQIQI